MIVGVDEVGRGPLFGSVVAAACVLPEDYSLEGLNDSKKLNEEKREHLAKEIRQQAIVWSIAEASVEEIDEINILQASLLAMHRAVDALSITDSPIPPSNILEIGENKPQLLKAKTGKVSVLEEVLVDGNKLPSWQYKAKAIVGGDGKEACISAASILAKVYRDQQMKAYAKEYPQYGFEAHKLKRIKAIQLNDI